MATFVSFVLLLGFFVAGLYALLFLIIPMLIGLAVGLVAIVAGLVALVWHGLSNLMRES